jgi:hypothetical protein
MHALSWASWFLVAYAEATKAATSESLGVVRVDLAFPRNETYATSQFLPIVFAVKNAGPVPYIKPQISFQIWEWDNFTRSEVLDTYDLARANYSSSEPYFEYSRRFKFDKEAVWEMKWSVSWYSCRDRAPDEESVDNQRILYNSTNHYIIFTTKESSSGHDLDLVAATNNTNCSENLGDTSTYINITDTMKVSNTVDWDRYTSWDHDTVDVDIDNKLCAVVPSTAPLRTGACPIAIGATAATKISEYMASLDCRATSSAIGACELGDNNESVAQRLAVGTVAFFGAAFGAMVLLLS